jgi:hypothetical protein
MLFPILDESDYGNSDGDCEKTWKNRICESSEAFDRYFQMTIPLGQISESELEDFFDITDNREDIVSSLNKWNNDQREHAFRQMLERDIKKIKEPVLFISALIDYSEENFDFVKEAIVGLTLRSFSDTNTDISHRNTLALEITKRIRNIIGLSWFSRKLKSVKDARSEIVSDDIINSINQTLLEKIKLLVREENLIKHKGFVELYYTWKNLSGEEEVLNWTRLKIKNERDAILILDVFTDKVSDASGRTRTLSLAAMEKVVPLAQWNEIFARREPSSLSERERENLSLFERAKKRRNLGLPDGEWLLHEGEESRA